jgi:hypothetical protein
MDDFFLSLKLERRNKAHRSNQANTSTKAYGAELTETQAQQQQKHTHTTHKQKAKLKWRNKYNAFHSFHYFNLRF